MLAIGFCSPFVVGLPFVACCSLFVFRCSLFVVCLMVVVRCCSFVVGCCLLVVVFWLLGGVRLIGVLVFVVCGLLLHRRFLFVLWRASCFVVRRLSFASVCRCCLLCVVLSLLFVACRCYVLVCCYLLCVVCASSLAVCWLSRVVDCVLFVVVWCCSVSLCCGDMYPLLVVLV